LQSNGKDISIYLIQLKNIVYAFIVYSLLENIIKDVEAIKNDFNVLLSYSIVFALVITSIIHWSISVRKLPYYSNIASYVRYAVDFVVAFMYIGLVNILPSLKTITDYSRIPELIFWVSMVFVAYAIWDLIRTAEYHMLFRDWGLTTNLFARSIINGIFAVCIYIIHILSSNIVHGKILSQNYITLPLILVLVLIFIYRIIKNKIKRPEIPDPP